MSLKHKRLLFESDHSLNMIFFLQLYLYGVLCISSWHRISVDGGGDMSMLQKVEIAFI